MEAVIDTKTKITSVLDGVKEKSYHARVNQPSEETLNAFLDAISTFRDYLCSNNGKIEDVVIRLEELTWESDINEECLKLLSELISSASGLVTTLKKDYARFSKLLRPKGLLKNELGSYLSSIHDLEVGVEDIESVFFAIPKNEEFQIVLEELEQMKD